MGSITASCGHTLAKGEGPVPVTYGSECYNDVGGIIPCVVHALFCPSCAADWESYGLLLENTYEEDAWLAR